MEKRILESDRKLFRKFRPLGLERFCQRVLGEIRPRNLPFSCRRAGRLLASFVVWTVVLIPAWADPFEAEFRSPPEHTKPRCYWYWIDGQMSREGITRDLEAMRRVGIGEAYLGIIDGGQVEALSEPWWEFIEHAVREAGRIGVDVGLFNSPGWSQSGGPWVKPSQAMRYVRMLETRVDGPQRYAGKLPAPPSDFQDIAVLAFPAPAGEGEHAAITSRTPRAVTFEMPAPFTARSLTVHPIKAVNVTAELLASDDGKEYRPVRTFKIDRYRLSLNVGPIPLAPVVVSLPATTARFFQLTFSAPCELEDIDLSAAVRVERVMEKQLAKMFQDPLPPFDFYTWPTPAEPDLVELVTCPEAVVDLSGHVDADGTLRWEVPAGSWIVLRAVAMPTGTKNAPAPPEATGFEVDKMSREALRAHFDAYVGKLLARMPAQDRTALKRVVADSYEAGPQNWTDDFVADFESRYGYDPLRFFPVLAGRVVGSADQSDRFLWDLRRMVADRVAQDYVEGLRELCREHGLKMWLENYGHWGFPGEFLQYGGSADEIGGEFWVTGNLGSFELRAAASAAHIYGMPVVWAEAFTGGPAFRSTPASLKARGDWALSEGANQFVLHVYIHQPWEDRRPGMNAWFGTEFNRHNTWFNLSKAWIDYHRRCSVMLQAGKPVADVAYFIGEDAPKMTGPSKPELPAGYDFDYINADVIENRLRVEQGRFVLPDGVSYRLLVLPESETMRPALLQKLTELAAAGGAMLGGPPPKRSPSMQDYPACDAKVQQLADELWDSGKVMQGIGVQEALDRLDTRPDVICPDDILWKHRRDDKADIYFLANQRPWSRTETITFRVHDRAPELWWPETARIEHPAAYRTGEGTVQTPIHFGPHTSVFVVFRRPAAPDRVVDVTRNGQPVFDWRQAKAGSPSTASSTFTMAVWAKPEADTTLLPEANAGIRGMREQRNDAFPAPHGDLLVPGGSHAGAGIAIGRNGVAVFEHGASYFAPVLVHAAPLTQWTHVAVVYHEGRPRLFLDGVLVREGLQSKYIVHSGVTVDGGNPEFAGELGGSRSLPRAVDAQEVRALMKSMPRRVAEAMHPPIELMRGPNGGIVPHIDTAGRYTWITADGREHQVDVAEVPAPVELAGPWTVTFDPRNGGPAEPVPFAELVDWTRREEEGIRHYSGMATYRTTFDLAAGSQPRWLDLGDVRFLARVRLNGHHVGTVWKSPYRVDISEAVRSGANTLEIDVVNTWLNRLLGDDQRPVAERRTWATRRTWHGSPLPSGLLGPVCWTAER